MGLYNKYKKQEQPMIDPIHDVRNKIEKLANENRNVITTLVPMTSMPTSASALKPITQYATTSLGPTMTKYLNNRDDKVFGIYGERVRVKITLVILKSLSVIIILLSMEISMR
jgi:hypothetical protein